MNNDKNLKRNEYYSQEEKNLTTYHFLDGKFFSINGILSSISLANQKIISTDFIERWLVNGKEHRIDAPSSRLHDGSEYWFRDGKLHREDGPAIDAPYRKEGWENGQPMSKEKIQKIVSSIEMKEKLDTEFKKEFPEQSDKKNKIKI